MEQENERGKSSVGICRYGSHIVILTLTHVYRLSYVAVYPFISFIRMHVRMLYHMNR